MTCRGYDPKAVKVPSLVKIAAARILDVHKRGKYIRSYVEAISANSKYTGRTKNTANR